MPRTVELPNYGVFNYPDEMTDDEIYDDINNSLVPSLDAANPDPEQVRNAPHLFPDIDRGSVLGGLDSSTDRLGRAPEAIGAGVFRSQEELDSLKTQMAKEKYDQRYRASLDDVTDQWGKGNYLDAAGTLFGDVLPQTLGESIPDMGIIGAGAIAGAKAGTLAGAATTGPFAPVGAVAGAVGGAVIGAAIAGLPTFFGMNVERQIQENNITDPNEIKTLQAAGVAALQGGMEAMILPALNLLPGVKGLVGREISDLVAGGVRSLTTKELAGRVAGHAAMGGATEAVTEVGQQALERAQAGLDVSPMQQDALKEYIEAAVLGGLLGIGFGGLSGGYDAKTINPKLEKQWAEYDQRKMEYEADQNAKYLDAMSGPVDPETGKAPLLLAPPSAFREGPDLPPGEAAQAVAEATKRKQVIDGNQEEAVWRAKRNEIALKNARNRDGKTPEQLRAEELGRLARETTPTTMTLEEIDAVAPEVAKRLSQQPGDVTAEQNDYTFNEIVDKVKGNVPLEGALQEQVELLHAEMAPETAADPEAKVGDIEALAQERRINTGNASFDAFVKHVSGASSLAEAAPYERKRIKAALEVMPEKSSIDLFYDPIPVRDLSYSHKAYLAALDIVRRRKDKKFVMSEVAAAARKADPEVSDAGLKDLRDDMVDEGFLRRDKGNIYRGSQMRRTTPPKREKVGDTWQDIPKARQEQPKWVDTLAPDFKNDIPPPADAATISNATDNYVTRSVPGREWNKDTGQFEEITEHLVIAHDPAFSEEQTADSNSKRGPRVISRHKTAQAAEEAALTYGTATPTTTTINQEGQTVTADTTDVDLRSMDVENPAVQAHRARQAEIAEAEFSQQPIVKKMLDALGSQKVANYLRKHGVSTTVVDRLKGAPRAEGVYRDKSINLSLAMAVEATNNGTEAEQIAELSRVFNHEIIHALRDLKVITQDDFNTMIKYVTKKKRPAALSRSGKDITYLQEAKERYTEMAIDEALKKKLTGDKLKEYVDDYVAEEAVAEAFRDWAVDRKYVTGRPASIFGRIMKFIRTMGGLLRENGITETEQLFDLIQSGEKVGGGGTTRGGGARQSIAGTAIKFKGKMYKSDRGATKHTNIMMPKETLNKSSEYEYGYYDHKGRWMDRWDAYDEAAMSDQLTDAGKAVQSYLPMLLSEQLDGAKFSVAQTDTQPARMDFSDEKINSIIYDHSNNPDEVGEAEAHFVRINIDTYLDLTAAESGRASRENIEQDDFGTSNIEPWDQTSQTFDPMEVDRAGRNAVPFFAVNEDGKVVGHEGRHRAASLKRGGATTIPVVMVYKAGADSWSGRKGAPMPRTLTAQSDNTIIIPMLDSIPAHRDNFDAIKALVGEGTGERSEAKFSLISNDKTVEENPLQETTQRFDYEVRIPARDGTYNWKTQSVIARNAEEAQARAERSALAARGATGSKLGDGRSIQGLVQIENLRPVGPKIKAPKPPKYSIAPAVDSPAFKKWFKQSEIINEDGSPMKMYTGTGNEFDTFWEDVVFFSPDPEMANKFATTRGFQARTQQIADKLGIDEGSDVVKTRARIIASEDLTAEDADYLHHGRPRVIPSYLSLQKVWDFEKTEHLGDIRNEIAELAEYHGMTLSETVERFQDGDWQFIEHPDIQEAIETRGYDGFYVKEGYGGPKNVGVFTAQPNAKSIFNEEFDAADPKFSIGAAQDLLRNNPESLGLTPDMVTRISPVYRPEALPTSPMATNKEGARWLEQQFEGTRIEDMTAVLTDAHVEELATIMAAEVQLGLENSGSAFDWYSGALDRTIDIVKIKYPMIADDAAAAEAGFGTASNARFVFTYIMAVTSQNLAVRDNAIATDKAFTAMLERIKKGQYGMLGSWATGDKQKAMAKNFAKFGPMLKAMPGKTFADQLTALDAVFRESMTVGEWVKEMKKRGVPYTKPGQTAVSATVYGSSILGPKIGNGFWQNLNHNFSPLTIDLWMRRTWGRLTGKSIGNPGALPGQRARFKDAIIRSRSLLHGKEDHIEAARADVRLLEWELAEVQKIPPSDFGLKKYYNEEINRLKAEIKLAEEVIPDLRGIKAPEQWRPEYNRDQDALLAYAKRVLSVWNKEYARLRKISNSGEVPADLQPTWARAAKTIITNLGKPLDQVANGTQRIQIEKVGLLAQQMLAGRGIDITTADMQAVLWYPEKDLWGSLTTELETDEDGVVMVTPNPLNESYDTAFAAILRGQGYEIQDTEGTGSRGDGASSVTGSDARSDQPQSAEGVGRTGTGYTGPEGEGKFSIGRPSIERDAFNQLTRRDQTLLAKAKSGWKRWMMAGGHMPQSSFDAKILKDNQNTIISETIEAAMHDLHKAVRAEYGRRYDQLSKQQLADIAAFLGGDASVRLPEDVRLAAFQMRAQVDHLSGEVLPVLDDKIADLEQRQANSRDPRAFIEKINRAKFVRETVVGNMGRYLTRSYRVHDDPKWNQKVSLEVTNAAYQHLMDQYKDSDFKDLAAKDLHVKQLMQYMLENGTAFSGMEAFISESKLGSKDLSVLKRRNDIAPEIRAFLGEYTDPEIKYVRSMEKMGALVHNHHFLKTVREKGLGVYIWENDGSRPPEATQQIAGENSEVMSPLEGMWVTPEVNQAFLDAVGPNNNSEIYNKIVGINGRVKWGKTVGSMPTQVRNFVSAGFFTVATANLGIRHVRKAGKTISDYILETPGGMNSYRKELLGVGVIHDTPNIDMALEMLKDAGIIMSDPGAEQGSGPLRNVNRRLRNIGKIMNRMYRSGDDFWKIIAYETMIDILMTNKGMTRAEASPEAAKRTRNRIPTYSLTGKAMKALGKFPILGPFVSFSSEIIRTDYHIVKQIHEDLQDPQMRGYAFQTMAGFGLAHSWAAGVAALSAAVMGIDGDEEEAARLLGSPWSRNSSLFFWGRDDKGKLMTVDLSFIDPYNMLHRPFVALMRNQPWKDRLGQAFEEMISPFFGLDIAAGGLFELAQNKKIRGGAVFNEDAPAVDQMWDITEHIIETIAPGTVPPFVKIYKASQDKKDKTGRVYDVWREMAGLFGLRITTLDPAIALNYRAYEFKDKLGNASRYLANVAGDLNEVSEDKLLDTFETANEIRQDAYREMRVLVNAARKGGVSDATIRRVLRSSGVSKRDANALAIDRDQPKWRIGKTFLQGNIKRAKLLIDSETAQALKDRQKAVRNAARSVQ
jgi:hypothetical protein